MRRGGWRDLGFSPQGGGIACDIHGYALEGGSWGGLFLGDEVHVEGEYVCGMEL